MSVGKRVRLLPAMIGLAVFSLSGSTVYADAMYGITDLGTIGTNSNSYLNQLSASDRAAFQQGSFDATTHPASNAGPLPQGEWWTVTLNSGDWTASPNDTQPITMNDHGQVVGLTGGLSGQDAIFEYDPSLSPSSAHIPVSGGGGYNFVSDPQTSQALSVGGINDNGEVVGSIKPLPFGGYHAYLFGPGGTKDLGTLGPNNGNSDFYSAANALNNAGQVVGSSTLGPQGSLVHAFLYSNGAMEDLNSLIPSSAGISLSDAVGIDASGRVVAVGTDASGVTHEYLLTPVPEPSTLAFFGVVAFVFAARRQRTARTMSDSV